MEDTLIYRSYLLRMWQVREGAGLAWRATLEDVKTGEKCGFTSLKELTTFLRKVTDRSLENNEDGSPTFLSE